MFTLFQGKNLIKRQNMRFCLGFNYVKTKHLVTDLAFLRHAQSTYNVASQKYIKENNIEDLKWDEICQIQDFNLDINFNRKFVDCELSDRGANQCYELKNNYEAARFDYDLILVSPLERALRTCRNTFEFYPIKKIVLPQLTEAFRYACDVSQDIEEKRQEYKEFDFGHFQKNNNLWILNTQPKQVAKAIITTIADKQLITYDEIQQEMVMMMYQGKIYESDYDMRLRCRKIKKIIERYRQQYRKIIVISHHYIIQNLLAQGYRSNHQPIISMSDQVPNAVPITTSLQQILNVK